MKTYEKVIIGILIISILFNLVIFSNTKQLSERIKQVNDTIERIESIQQSIKDEYTKFEKFNKELGNKISNIEQSISRIGTTIQSTQNTISGLRDTISGITVDLQSINRIVSEIDGIADESGKRIREAQTIIQNIAGGNR